MTEIENTQLQNTMQSLFFTMDQIRSDLKICGEYLTEPFRYFSLPAFEYSPKEMKLKIGKKGDVLAEDAPQNSTVLEVFDKLESSNFREGMDILIYYYKDAYYYTDKIKVFEFNTIKALDNTTITLSRRLKNDFRRGADIIPLNVVQYKLFEKERLLKKRTGNKPWQIITESATGFQITFYPDCNSVLYRLEVNEKEQLRGYAYLPHLVKW